MRRPITNAANQNAMITPVLTSQIIEGDVNGDAKEDFSIEIKDPTHAITLTSADFIL
jgi:hypothetical protein